jgi:hypothetical protein
MIDALGIEAEDAERISDAALRARFWTAVAVESGEEREADRDDGLSDGERWDAVDERTRSIRGGASFNEVLGLMAVPRPPAARRRASTRTDARPDTPAERQRRLDAIDAQTQRSRLGAGLLALNEAYTRDAGELPGGFGR